MTPLWFELGIPFVAGAFGATVGSFLNVVIYRLARYDDEEEEAAGTDGSDPAAPPEPTRSWREAIADVVPSFVESLRDWRAVAEPKRSHCPSCANQIAWYDNIPLFSYLALGARCRQCRAPISIRYFTVELITAVLFAVAAHLVIVQPVLDGAPPQFAVLFVHTAFIAAVLACAFIDLDRMIIPDAIDKPGTLLAIAVAPLVPAMYAAYRDIETLAAGLGLVGVGLPIEPGTRVAALASAAFGAFVGAAIIYAIGWAGARIFKKEAMGLGDVKYMALLGAVLGWKGVLLTLLVACLAGAAIGIVLKLARGAAYIPFGPFLSIGALAVLLAREHVVWAIFEWYPQMVMGGGA